MRRIVIDLNRDLPYRAVSLSEETLSGIFGGSLPCSGEGGVCGTFGGSYGVSCCAGLTCRPYGVIPGGRCVK